MHSMPVLYLLRSIISESAVGMDRTIDVVTGNILERASTSNEKVTNLRRFFA